MDNPEKLATKGTQDEERENKTQHNMCWTPVCAKHRHLRSGFFCSSILSIKCASTTYMNPFDMLRCEINAFMNYAPFS
jgi:hypothetical protein